MPRGRQPEGETTLGNAERQARYERLSSTQFKVVVEEGGEGVGWVGYWDREVHREPVFEIGWAVVPSHQGRGIAATLFFRRVGGRMSAGCLSRGWLGWIRSR